MTTESLIAHLRDHAASTGWNAYIRDLWREAAEALVALTARAEQAERERDELRRDLQVSRADYAWIRAAGEELLVRARAAKADAEALRQALRDLACYECTCHPANIDGVMVMFASEVAALLACEGRGRPQLQEHDEKENALARTGELDVSPSPQHASENEKA